MKKLIYDPFKSGPKAKIVCFVSGSGTNYREIVKKNPEHYYFVFTNRPDCKAVEIARSFRHPVIQLSHIPFLREARKKYGAGNVPRNHPDRMKYEQEACAMIERIIGGQPDLVCPAGYDLWTTDWMVERYYPRILNVHPGDTTKGYDGLHWVPSAKAIIAGDDVVRSTLFIVDKSEDKGPVILQSHPLQIKDTLSEGASTLIGDFDLVMEYITTKHVGGYTEFKTSASKPLQDAMSRICEKLQEKLKIHGDWEIYPLAVQWITQGRIATDNQTILLDDRPLPAHGYRL